MPGYHRRTWLIAVCWAVFLPVFSEQPSLKWEFRAQTNLYASPLVADVHPSPGLETLISDSEARSLRCIGAQGTELWSFRPGWKKRLTASAALSFTARPGKGTLAIANPDGTLYALDADSGASLWKKEIGKMEWSSPMWVDLNNDQVDELVVPTETDGITVFRADGKLLWKRTQTNDGIALSIQAPAAAGDVDGDNAKEIFATTASSIVCVNQDGSLRWEYSPGYEMIGAPTVGRLKKDAGYTVLALSRKENLLHIVDGPSGVPLHTAALLGAPDLYAASSIAVGDLVVDDSDESEIVLGDGQGNLYCFSANAKLLWTYKTEKAASVCCTLGDVDGDGIAEVLGGGADHYLYCLSYAGKFLWRFGVDLRIVHSPTLADIDLDGKTEILFGASDGKLRCLATEGCARPEYAAFPARRFDNAQTGFVPEITPLEQRLPVVHEESLLRNPTFSQTYAQNEHVPGSQEKPTEWIVETPNNGEWSLRFNGNTPAGITTQARDAEFQVSSVPVQLSPNTVRVKAAVRCNKESASAFLEWLGTQGVLMQTPLTIQNAEVASTIDTCQYCLFAEQSRPLFADAVRLILKTQPGTSVAWEQAEIQTVSRFPKTVEILTNQVGYDLDAPKRFVVQTNFHSSNAIFQVLTKDGKVVLEKNLIAKGRIIGAYGQDWESEYWQGDFTELNTPGDYSLKVIVGDTAALSQPVQIGKDLLWQNTARLAYRFFYFQRCGTEVPGYHKPCHLDDAVSADGTQLDLTGGWHDAGDYNKYHNAPYLYGLVRAYQIMTETPKNDDQKQKLTEFFEEILWGAEHVYKMVAPDGSAYGPITSGYGFWGPPEIETDNIPNTGDERPISGAEKGHDPVHHAAALAKIAHWDVPHCAAYVEAARRGFSWREQQGKKDLYQLSIALDLYELTRENQYAESAKRLFEENADTWLNAVPLNSLEYSYLADAVEKYDKLFQQDHTQKVATAVIQQADRLLEHADNPFGILTFGDKEKPNFFNTPEKSEQWHIGTNSHLLNAAAGVALACRFGHKSAYYVFLYDQLNWIFGVNPFGICMMESAGIRNLPSYHNRLTFAGVSRGAVPGGIINGVTYRHAGDDRPYLDLRGVDIPDFEPNEFWLPHNTAYLNVLANMISMKIGKTE